MEDFFKKGLTDYSEAEDGWNIPSDDLWHNAKPHFPKPIEKRKTGVATLFGLMLLLGVAAVFYCMNDKTIEVNQEVAAQDKIQLIDKNEDLTVSGDLLPLVNQKINVETPIQLEEAKPNSQSQTLNPAHDQTPTAIAQETEVENNSQLTSVFNLNRKLPLSFDKNLVATKKLDNEINKQPLVEGPNVKQESQIEQAIEKPTLADIIPLNVLALQTKDQNLLSPHQREMKSPKLIIPEYRKYHKHELGIGHQKYLVNLLTHINFNRSELDTLNIDGKFRSINLHYTRWLPNDRWSITTGLYAADFQLDIYANQSDVIGEETLKSFVSSEMGNQINPRNIDPANENCIQFQLMLHPGETVSASDSIRVKARVDAGLVAVQLPFMLKRHWYKKHMEYSIGVGGALDHVWYDEDIHMLQVHKEGRAITKPFSEYISNSEFSFSALVEFGTHIYLSDHFNLGFKTRINPTAFIFSGAEMGLYYRW